MFFAYSTKDEVTFTPFESRDEAVAFLLNGDENAYIDNGTLTMKRGCDYTKDVFDGPRAAVASMLNGDEYSLPETLRALANAFEAAQE